ncbi:helix-turn-helix transcriptional regulator [Facklamia sp. DSM 111018]|uniref:Helix-turn-helix transcriptional regulator n=1 Tax=Facklamia lactis TaxID=2749967 RepID=A0ABS0LRJ8_9LACT|nr:metalloregulator ArsR/SmtB family transcription factor [Facklamia lactis]MBG9980783.1 helix-turn-helix transcriptional regulator [Facklamia lactis]MBG9986597.1 helix-turn-helix transcriptional regulator [Facklamia lactis]
MSEYACLDNQELELERDKIRQLFQPEILERKATIFKILGDLNRVKIVELLMNYDKLCVYEISQFIGASVATTSHHLITLKNHHIINSEKEGKHVIYSMSDEIIGELVQIANGLNISCPTKRLPK